MSPIEEDVEEKMEACEKAEFPICLDRGLLWMFGAHGKKSLDAIVMNDTFENTEISSPKDICKIYEKYMERSSNILGETVAKVIESQCLNQPLSIYCTTCPLYEKRKATGRI